MMIRAVVVAASVFVALQCLPASAAETTATLEIYISHGGWGALELERNAGEVRIKYSSDWSESPDTKVRQGTDTLELRNPRGYSESGQGEEVNYVTRFVRGPGSQDWSYAWHGQYPPSKDLDPWDAEPLTSPVPYLHRLDDPDVINFYSGADALWFGKPIPDVPTTTVLLEVADRLAANHLSDPYCGAVTMFAALRTGDENRLKSAVQKWEPLISRANDATLSSTLAFMKWALQGAELNREGRNGYPLVRQILATSETLDARLARLSDILKFDAAIEWPMRIADSPTFLGHLFLVKVARTVAELRLLQGRRHEALMILAGSYRVGQLYTKHSSLSSRVIGSMLRMVVLGGLRDFIFNACETRTELQDAWNVLQELERLDCDPKRDDPEFMAEVGGQIDKFSRDERFQRLRADGLFEGLRVCTAAKAAMAERGQFPKDRDSIPPLLSTIPADPFKPEDALKHRGLSDGFECYSVGPDLKDDGGRIEYDPTNGTVSRGDIVTSFPTQRRYPFPASPVVANSAKALRKQFLSGLPLDVFADMRGRGLSITESTPVCVYSYGPDIDQDKILPIEKRYRPTVQYDPTNGTISGGDIFITLPMR